MSKNYETGIDPNLKEQINKEGWETGKDYNLKTEEEKEGGAAVFVGAKEEAEKAREIVETEGKAENLGSYIKMHKIIKVRSDEMELTGNLSGETIYPRRGWLMYGGIKGLKLFFLDKDSNLAEVEIKVEDVISLKEGGNIVEELRNLGFEIQELYPGTCNRNEEYLWIKDQINKKEAKINQEAEERQKKEFDF